MDHPESVCTDCYEQLTGERMGTIGDELRRINKERERERADE